MHRDLAKMYVNALHWDELERITGKKNREKLIDSEKQKVFQGISRYVLRAESELLPSFITVTFVRVSTTHSVR